MKLAKKAVLTLTDGEYDMLWQARYILGKIIDLFGNTKDYGEDHDNIRESADKGYECISHILNNIPEGLD